MMIMMIIIISFFQMSCTRVIKNNFITCVYLMFTLIFLIQSYRIVLDFIYPSTLNTVTFKEELKDSSFPLGFRLCVKPGFDKDELFKNGYKNNRYNSGQSRFNNSIFGWAGHFEEESNFSETLTAEGDYYQSILFFCNN